MKRRPLLAIGIGLLVSALAWRYAAAAKEGDELIGKPAPAWETLAWAQGALRLPEDARGRVVLVRYWTDTCPLCEATAPALNEFHERYAKQGLLVLGVYHPKPPRPSPPAAVRATAERLGFRFPVAIDEDWSMLRRWWLDRNERRFTSVSFLIDRQGRMRFIHPGGEYHRSADRAHAACRRDYDEMKAQVERLLGEGDRH